MTGFFNELFGGYPSGSIEIRLLPPKGSDLPIVQRWFGLAPEYLCMARRFAVGRSSDYNAYYGVLPRASRGGAWDRDCTEAGWIWADIDCKSGEKEKVCAYLTHIAKLLPLPRFVVLSGGGCHLYWPLASPISLFSEEARREFADMEKRLALLLGESDGCCADAGVGNASRILRVPGTWNHKTNPPRPVRAIRVEKAEALRWTWLDANCPMLPGLFATAADTSKAREWKGYVPEGLLAWMTTGFPVGGRHKRLAGAARWLLTEVGAPDDGTFEAMVRAKAQASGLPPRDAVSAIGYARSHAK